MKKTCFIILLSLITLHVFAQKTIKITNATETALVKDVPGDWMPGTKDGKPVSVEIAVPVKFSLY